MTMQGTTATMATKKQPMRSVGVWFLAMALLTASSALACAQVSVQQQMPNYTSVNSSAAITARMPLPAVELKVAPEDIARMKLAPGFLVSLQVLDDPDFTGNFRVDQEGALILPIVGGVRVAGQTAPQARAAIENVLLEKKILRHPQAILSVVEYTTPGVTVIGEVANPGRYPLLAPQKLVDVLAYAGGPTLVAGNEVQITPTDPDAKPVLVHYSRTANPASVADVYVRPGDTVQMKRAGIIYVLGAVTRPGGYVMQEEGKLNILQAISLANGTSNIASIKTVYVIRKNADGGEVDMAVPYKKITQGKAADVQLQATDILFVPTSGVKSALINGQGVLSAAASASIYAAAVN